MSDGRDISGSRDPRFDMILFCLLQSSSWIDLKDWSKHKIRINQMFIDVLPLQSS